MKSTRTAFLTSFMLFTGTITAIQPGGTSSSPQQFDMDPLTMMSLMGGMGGGMPGMDGGLPGMNALNDMKKAFSALTSKVPSREELFRKSNEIRLNLRRYNRDRNLPFIRRVERIYLKVSPFPSFSSLDDIKTPKKPLSPHELMSYERHLRCLESLAAVNEEGKEEQYEEVLKKLITRYDL
ncbi:MAG: hypothetical protein PVJ92_00485, partial [Candidatus Dependentiae bacterium]